MFLWVKTKILGEVDRVDDTVIATEFGVINGVLFVPETSLVIRKSAEGDVLSQVEIPVVWRSVFVTYVRSWSLLFALFVALIGALSVYVGWITPGLVCFGIALASGAGGRSLAWLIARTSATERDMRRVYAAWLGLPVDARRLGKPMEERIDRLRGHVVARASGTVSDGYRATRPTIDPWYEVASRSSDASLLGAAFTLARAELAYRPRSAQARALRAWHRELWKLLAPNAAGAAAVEGMLALQAGEPIRRDGAALLAVAAEPR